MRAKPTVGQIVYSLNIGNAARRQDQVLTPMRVTKIGRKYFTCLRDGWMERMSTQFHLDGWGQKTEYSAVCMLYESKQEWRDEKEEAEICKRIYVLFDYGRNRCGLSLDQLRRIDIILNDNTPTKPQPTKDNK